jgi:non-heme chloroperoxidase
MTNRSTFKVQTEDGLTLVGVRQGPRSPQPIVLLHGYSDTHHSFAPLLDALPPDLNAIAFTQRGHGDSSKPLDAYRAADFARDVKAVLADQGCDKAILVGHSMGSRVALRFTLDWPEHVAGLVLIGAFAGFAGNAGVQLLWDEDVSNMADPVDPEFVRAFQESASSENLPKSFLDDVIAQSLKMPAHAWRSALRAMLDEELIDDLDRITVPVRLIWGDQDPFAGRVDQDRLLRALPGARLSVAEGFGHSPHWENPHLAARGVADFRDAVVRSEADRKHQAAA